MTEIPSVVTAPSRAKAYALLVTGLVACPCHIPLWIGLVAGTAFGVAFLPYLVPVAVVMGVYFVFALLRGLRMLRECDACELPKASGGRLE